MRNRIEDIVLRFLEKPGMLLRFFIPGKFLKITVGTLCALLIVVPGFETAFGKSEEMSEIAVSPAAQALYEAATPYVGSVSEVSGLLHILRENGIFPEEEGTMELLTEEPPTD